MKEPEQLPAEACVHCGGALEGFEHLTLRGKHYVIRELTAEEYEVVAAAANIPSPTEPGETVTDMNILRRTLVIQATTEDGKQLTPEMQKKLKQPVYGKLDILARRMHWGEIESDEEAAERRERENIPSP